MKILHATEVEIGGTVSVLMTLLQNQLTSGTIQSSICLVPEKQLESLIDIPSSNINTYKRSGRNFLSFFSFIVSLIKITLKEKPDIIHLHSTFAGILGRIALAPLLPFTKAKIIYCPHGFSFLMDGSNKKKKIFSIIESLLSKITHKIICVSDYEKKSAINAGIEADNIVVIHNGVSNNDSSVEAIVEYPFSGNNLNLIFVGRLDPAKGFDTLLAAMKHLEGEPVHLTVLGISGSEIPDEARSANISYMGWCNQEEMRPYFTYADVLVLTSRWEGFPMVVLEAMNFSTAVVASNCTSLSESVKHGLTGFLFPTSDHEKLAEIISNTPIEKWNQLGSNGRKYYLDNFTSEKMTQSTYNLYKSLLDKPRTRERKK
ncbi:glycosyltransferase [Pseudomonas fluorescens]|uniref:D-inositol-3-phosphate glycosyltransferase n=1 Tax=Pseudomonas fluorescens TaxID=294 RepID=A0A5E7CE91_PSEFL|nr:glycosyltransferase [Pseudomonas fluorescens]VVO03199.1 D-inositol-3-phosphate glycosyltransferase [Pseudomonas fluorescens]